MSEKVLWKYVSLSLNHENYYLNNNTKRLYWFSEPSLIAWNCNVLKTVAWSYSYCFFSSFIHSLVPANASLLLIPHISNKRHGIRKLEQHSTESTSYPRSPSGQNSNGYYTVTTSHIYVSLWITVEFNSKLHCHIGILFPSNYGLVLHICFSSHLLLYSSCVHHN